MAKLVDLELEKAISLVKVKIEEAKKRIEAIELELKLCVNSYMQLILSKRAIDKLPTDVEMYEKVGRMFVRFENFKKTAENVFVTKERDIKAKTEELKNSRYNWVKILDKEENLVMEMEEMFNIILNS